MLGRHQIGATQLALFAGLVVLVNAARLQSQAAPAASAVARDDAAAEKLGWQLGAQAWTFRDRTAFEAIDTAKKLGLKYIELFPGQTLSPEHKDVKVDVGLSAELLNSLKQKLASAGVKAMSFGVVNMTKDAAATRKVFEFARALGLANVSAEPEPDAFDVVDQLANEFKINVALHNHPEGSSRYWSPDAVLAAIQGRGQRIGSCSDTGHWTRSNLKPVDCLKKLAGHVIELHFKDLNEFGNKNAIDVPWGTGKSDARGILAELKRQGFKGLINVEYEDGSGAVLEANVAKCVAFFDQTARELAASK